MRDLMLTAWLAGMSLLLSLPDDLPNRVIETVRKRWSI